MRKNETSLDSPQLRARISVLFNQIQLEDADILHVLKREGYSINSLGLQRIRRNMCLVRRVNPFDREESDREDRPEVDKIKRHLHEKVDIGDCGILEWFIGISFLPAERSCRCQEHWLACWKKKVRHLYSRGRIASSVKVGMPRAKTDR